MPNRYDFAADREQESKLAYYRQHFTLYPDHLRKLTVNANLRWRKTRFQPARVASVANGPGVYAFVIQHRARGITPHGYVLYIGQTGAKKPQRKLRQRFKEYIAEEAKEITKRPRVREFLNKWKGYLTFYFAVVDPNSVDLLELERNLNDALMPPYSVEDFSPEIRKRKRILESM